jgi:DNA invertase Pin-like site-specific DNA recombinase
MERKKKTKKCTRRTPLSEKHYEAIALLAASGRKRLTHERIARKLRINRRTLYRWRQRPDFEQELRKIIDREVNAIHRKFRMKMRGMVRIGDIGTITRFLSVNGVV